MHFFFDRTLGPWLLDLTTSLVSSDFPKSMKQQITLQNETVCINMQS